MTASLAAGFFFGLVDIDLKVLKVRRNVDASSTDEAVRDVVVVRAMRFRKAPYWPIPASLDTLQWPKLQNTTKCTQWPGKGGK